MKIDKLIYEHFAELRLRGEFDTFYAPKLGEEVDKLIGEGTLFAVLNLRLVKFINSTALGAIIKAHKRFKAEGGECVIGQPSPFVKSVITKLGIDKIVPMCDSIEDAHDRIKRAMLSNETPDVIGDSNVLFHFPDAVKSARMGERKTGLGTVLSVDHERIRFTWKPTGRALSEQDLQNLFAPGTILRTKFVLKLFKKGFFEVEGKIDSSELRESDEGEREIVVTSRFVQLSESDRLALAQYADDLDYLKKQLEDVQ